MERCTSSLIGAFVIGWVSFAGSTCYAGYGAIAFSSSDGVVGFSYGSGSKMDAERWAIQDCREKGGKDCAAVGWEQNCCAALAAGKNNGYAFDLSEWRYNEFYDDMYEKFRAHIQQDAKDKAIAACEKFTSECVTRAWICS
jgi:hypothetical protein